MQGNAVPDCATSQMRAILGDPPGVRDADLAKFLKLAKGDLERAVNYYFDSPISKVTLQADSGAAPVVPPRSPKQPPAPQRGAPRRGSPRPRSAQPGAPRPLESPPIEDLDDDDDDHSREGGAAHSTARPGEAAAPGAAGRPPSPAAPAAAPSTAAGAPAVEAVSRAPTRDVPDAAPDASEDAQPAVAAAAHHARAAGCAPSAAPPAPRAESAQGALASSLHGPDWAEGAPVPYSHLAHAFEALAATRSRLRKETILCACLERMLARRASGAELVAACHLLAPTKDPQGGGHRLLPDWEAGDVLNIGRAAITQAIADATGSTPAALRAASERARDIGDAAMLLRDGGGGGRSRGGRQALLLQPGALSVRAVYEGLLSLAQISGAGAERRRASVLTRLLRAASGSQLRWLARTLPPHLAVGVSLEAKVLPALGAAAAVSAGLARDETGELAKAAADAARRCFALCPRVDALVGRLCARAPEAARADAVRRLIATFEPARAEGAPAWSSVVQLGSPPQPMLAKAATSAADVLRRLAAATPSAARGSADFCAEFKYDGQRAQVHVLRAGRAAATGGDSGGRGAGAGGGGRHLDVRLFSRKLDDISAKYPDVARAVRAAVEASGASGFALDCEIVAVGPKAAGAGAAAVGAAAAGGARDEAEGGAGGEPAAPAAQASADATPAHGVAEAAAAAAAAPAAAAAGGAAGVHAARGSGGELLAFQALSTRKRTHASAAAADAQLPVSLVVFDLLVLDGVPLLHEPFRTRRAALRQLLPGARPSHGAGAHAGARVCLAASVDVCEPAAGEEGWGTAAGVEPAVAQLTDFLDRALDAGCEGLMCKRLASPYTPDALSRSDDWLKLKRDYIEGLGDSLDLVPIGGWRGSGRKSQWVSPWLLACYDARSATFQSVCRVMSGFSDGFYAEHTRAYTGVEDVGELAAAAAEGDGEDEGEQPMGAGPSRAHRLLDARPAAYLTAEHCRYWFGEGEGGAFEVWEIRGAELSVSPVHCAARGLVDPQRGLSLRFPRFIRKRTDKTLAHVTTPEQLAHMYNAQARRKQGAGDSAGREQAAAASDGRAAGRKRARPGAAGDASAAGAPDDDAEADSDGCSSEARAAGLADAGGPNAEQVAGDEVIPSDDDDDHD